MEEYQVKEGSLWVRMPEEVDHHKAGYLSEQVDRYILEQKINNVVFDFSRTTFMDSSGIGILIGRYKKVNCFGGQICVVHVSRQIGRILRLSGMGKYVKIGEEVL